MNPVRAAAVALAAAAALLPASGSAGSQAACPAPTPAPLAFGKPIFIDESRAGGEPVSVVAHDGSIIVSAHAGTTHIYKNPQAAPGAGDFAIGYANQTLNWRSSDGGRTWAYVGLFGAPAGPHSASSTGFSDPDLTIDASGRIYNTEIDLANIAVFSSPDDGQSWPFANPEVTPGDRPWLAGQDENEVFLYVRSDNSLWRSTDGGLTFAMVNLGIPGDGGKLITDPLHPKTGLISALFGGGAAISADDGQTWETYPGTLGGGVQWFPLAAADRAGWIYSAVAGGYTGTGGGRGFVHFSYFDRAAKVWSEPISIPTPRGEALWPWVTAGDDGRVAVAWYQTHGDNPDEIYIYVAYSLNGHGSTVTCSDGSTKKVPPQFTVANASGRPVHVGKICQSGLGCNLTTDEGGDRRLGDFFTINFDHTGKIFVVSADTTLPNSVGGPKPVANPVFIKQSAGERLLARPDKIRPTRCLFPLPTC